MMAKTVTKLGAISLHLQCIQHNIILSRSDTHWRYRVGF